MKNRVTQHKEKIFEGFTKKYNVDKLGYFEEHTDMRHAIEREKTLKNMLREKKIGLIQSMNPEWKDLFYPLSLRSRVQGDRRNVILERNAVKR